MLLLRGPVTAIVAGGLSAGQVILREYGTAAADAGLFWIKVLASRSARRAIQPWDVFAYERFFCKSLFYLRQFVADALALRLHRTLGTETFCDIRCCKGDADRWTHMPSPLKSFIVELAVNSQTLLSI
jgi:hypothetical protein